MMRRLPLLCQTLILCVGAFGGCAQTYLTGSPLGKEYLRLAAAAPKQVLVSMQVPAAESTLGRQWVFGVLPLGRVATADEAQLIGVALFKRLAIRGYSAVFLQHEDTTPGAMREPALTVTSATTRCSVPDLLVVRIVRCSVTVAGSSAKAPSLQLKSTGESSAFRFAGFKPQLESALDDAAAQALDGLLNQMHL